MVSDKFIALMQTVKEKTKEGGINWEPTPDEGGFQANLARFIIHIHTQPAEDGPNYTFTLLDSQGRTLEAASNFDMAEARLPDGLHPYQFLRGIFEEARRKALGTDEAIDNVLSFLSTRGLGLKILSASYGAGDKTKDVTEVLNRLIDGGRLNVPVNNAVLGGDPVPNTLKELVVNYSYSGEPLSKTVKEGKTLVLP